MWLALVTVQLSVAAGGATPVRDASRHLSGADTHMALQADAHLAAAGTTPTVSPAPGTSPGRQTTPGASAPRILVGGALLVAAFVVLLRRRGQVRPPSPRRGDSEPDQPDTRTQGQPPGPPL